MKEKRKGEDLEVDQRLAETGRLYEPHRNPTLPHLGRNVQ